MAFATANWSTVGASKSGNAPAIYSYKSSGDNKAAIAGSGYFNTVEALITTGDWIYTHGSDGGQTLVATNNGAGVITSAVI
tara:strand:- start:10222 stop:10464 length:243 start_codon:yes stop_codon:yes gene_type:complete